MLNLATVALFAALVASRGLAASPLGDLAGKARVLVVCAPSAADPRLERQNQELRAEKAGLKDRDLLVIRIVGNDVDAPSNLKLGAQNVRRAVGLSTAHFGVALIGKDGSEVFHRSGPITMHTLFEIIDAMPMRRQEIALRKP